MTYIITTTTTTTTNIPLKKKKTLSLGETTGSASRHRARSE